MASQPDQNVQAIRRPHPQPGDEVCPLCDQLLPHDLSIEVLQAKLKEKEQHAAQELERRLKAQHAKDVALRVEQAKKDAQVEATKREQEIRQEAKTQATSLLNAEIDKAQEAKSKAESEARAAQNQIKQLEEAQEQQIATEIQKALAQQREALENDKTDAIHKVQSEEFKKNQRLEKQVDQLKRQLDQKTAEARGEGAEVDLYEALRENFDDDRIDRIKKGQPGADILHEVRYNGQVCGFIIYDSKNHGAWRESFVQKLKADQLAAQADHAVLTTSAFPVGASQIKVKGDVILLNPARAVEVVRLIREHIIQTHRLRLSSDEREEKTKALYDFINSDRCRQLMTRYEKITNDLLDIDVTEVKAHNLVWKKRGQLLRDAQKVHSDYRAEIDQIIEGRSE
ncbi:MAG: DUF2130 domain-containing protein [Gammaproteobacteria bacterium]|nr:DUF2130 domain-containing protein [Gammaproteobacteria bacterium]